jgi:hypothetical protein
MSLTTGFRAMRYNVGIWIDQKKAIIVATSAYGVTTDTVEPDNEGRFYDEVIRRLGLAEALLIFGPGEAKMELKERLSRSKARSRRIVGIETTDTLTDPQIVAKVRAHYGA